MGPSTWANDSHHPRNGLGSDWMVSCHHYHLRIIEPSIHYTCEAIGQLAITFIPAVLHLLTASGTLDLGGSMRDIRPTKHRPCSGKLSCKYKGAILELSYKYFIHTNFTCTLHVYVVVLLFYDSCMLTINSRSLCQTGNLSETPEDSGTSVQTYRREMTMTLTYIALFPGLYCMHALSPRVFVLQTITNRVGKAAWLRGCSSTCLIPLTLGLSLPLHLAPGKPR